MAFLSESAFDVTLFASRSSAVVVVVVALVLVLSQHSCMRSELNDHDQCGGVALNTHIAFSWSLFA